MQHQQNKYTIEDFLEIRVSIAGSFSPDGSRVAFVSNETGTNQLYIAKRDGSERRQLTDYDDSVNVASFSPTDECILFDKASGGDEKTQFYLYDLETDTVRPLTEKPEVVHQWGMWSWDGSAITFSSNERNGTDFDVYVMDVASGEQRCVYDEGGMCVAVGFSPSGKEVIFRKKHSTANHDLYAVDTDTKKVTQLTPHAGDAEYLGVVRWLPDSSGFFAISNEERDLTGVLFFDRVNGTHEYVLTPDHEVDGITVSPDGSVLTVTTNEDGYAVLRPYDTRTFTPLDIEPFSHGFVTGARWSSDSAYLAYTFESPTKNRDIWIWDRHADTHHQVTESSCGVPEDVFVAPELVTYTSFDGLEIPAFVYTPKERSNEPMPAIVDIHGGPEEQYQPRFSSLTQYFVYHGYTVVAPNVRGSSGYGKAYMALDDREKRMDSVKDLTALHPYLASRGDIDPEKVVLMGASYGGYMTYAGLTFFPELWAAGVALVGFSNLVTFLENTSSYRRGLREAEYGYLATDRELLESISPLNYLEHIRAPLFIIHGRNDPRVPLSESEQIHEKLAKQGIQTELVIYDDEGHGLAKLKNRLDAYPQVVDFLNRALAE